MNETVAMKLSTNHLNWPWFSEFQALGWREVWLREASYLVPCHQGWGAILLSQSLAVKSHRKTHFRSLLKSQPIWNLPSITQIETSTVYTVSVLQTSIFVPSQLPLRKLWQ